MFAPANAAQFTLTIPTVRNDFKVPAFEGTKTISALYSIHIDLVSEYPDFDLESLLSQPAFLQFGHNGEDIHGRIENVVAGEQGYRNSFPTDPQRQPLSDQQRPLRAGGQPQHQPDQGQGVAHHPRHAKYGDRR